MGNLLSSMLTQGNMVRVSFGREEVEFGGSSPQKSVSKATEVRGTSGPSRRLLLVSRLTSVEEGQDLLSGWEVCLPPFCLFRRVRLTVFLLTGRTVGRHV